MKEITEALKMADDAVARNRWAILHVDKEGVWLEIGPVMQDGSRERKSATYKFYTDALRKVHFVVYAHP